MTGDPTTNVMLARLSDVYGAPESDKPQAFLREYARILRQYTDSELQAATDRLVAKRKYKTWPTIAECVDAAESARNLIRTRMAAEQNRKRLAAITQPKVYTAKELEEARQFVDDAADGKIDLGLCANALRKLAISMRNRRARGNNGGSNGNVD